MDQLRGSPEAPDELRTKYADWKWELVWQYGPEALTFRLSNASRGARYLKMSRADYFPGLDDEADRMAWAVDHLPVPHVIERGSDAGVSWLTTHALPGRNATDPALAGDPERLVRALAEGLRRFHRAPVEACPFDFRLDGALAHIRRRLELGHIQPERDFHPEFAHLSAEEAVEHLERTRPKAETLAVCHGDYCLPNVLIEEGVVTGFVDLGEVGVADRWWDLAVATWSVTWNLGPGHEDLFLSEYGVDRDDQLLDFYRLMYDVVS